MYIVVYVVSKKYGDFWGHALEESRDASDVKINKDSEIFVF
jgi:hypothetical protein